jgi:hypothetical protein
VSGLLTNVRYPIRRKLLFVLLGFLLGKVVVRRDLHALVPIALNLKVSVGNNDAVNVVSVDDRTRDHEVWKLDLKKHHIMLEEEEGPVDRLNA